MSRNALLFLGLLLIAATFARPADRLLAAGATLTGRVSDQASVGVAGATVDLNLPGTATLVGTSTTNGTGAYSVAVEEGTYDVRVTPPSGSPYQAFTSPNQAVTGTTTVNYTLVSASAVTLSGVLRDGLGNPLAGRGVILIPTAGGPNISVNAGASGVYSLSVVPGTYRLNVTVNATPNGAAVPQSYNIVTTGALNLSASQVLDLTIPVVPLVVRVQDPGGQGVAGVSVSSSSQTQRGAYVWRAHREWYNNGD